MTMCSVDSSSLVLAQVSKFRAFKGKKGESYVNENVYTSVSKVNVNNFPR